jgi:hypothetical protein
MSETVDVWNEVQITSNGVSISLYSEDEFGVTVEDEIWFTFEEMEYLEGEIMSLSLTDATRDALSKSDDEDDSEYRPIEDLDLNDDIEEAIMSGKEKARLPDEGDVMVDINSPTWSEDDRVEVVGIADETAGEYTIESGDGWSEPLTVANPSADPDEKVIEAQYIFGNNEVYAFPESRLEEE